MSVGKVGGGVVGFYESFSQMSGSGVEYGIKCHMNKLREGCCGGDR